METEVDMVMDMDTELECGNRNGNDNGNGNGSGNWNGTGNGNERELEKTLVALHQSPSSRSTPLTRTFSKLAVIKQTENPLCFVLRYIVRGCLVNEPWSSR